MARLWTDGAKQIFYLQVITRMQINPEINPRAGQDGAGSSPDASGGRGLVLWWRSVRE